MLCEEDHLLQNLLQATTATNSQSEDKLMLGFQDREKVYKILNATLLLVIIDTISNHTIFKFLIEDGSSCNVLYIDTLRKLEIRQQDHDLCDDISLLAFNDFITHPYGATNLLFSLVEMEGERKVTLSFLVVLCKISFSGILGRCWTWLLPLFTSN